MANFDPVAKAYIATGVPETPVDTLDALETHKLPKNLFHSCSEPSPDGGLTNKGCSEWYDCDMSYKGLPLKEGGGPRNHCWERLKAPENGGKVVRCTAPCFWGIHQQPAIRANDAFGLKEVLQVIADEGETYEMLTWVPDKSIPRDPKTGCFEVWQEKLVEVKVEPFQRIGQEQKLAQAELRASILARDKKKADRERTQKAIGIPTDSAPTDKRGRRGSESQG